MKEDNDTVICVCMGVTKGTIINAIKENDIKKVQDIRKITSAGSGCGTCFYDLERILKEEQDIQA